MVKIVIRISVIRYSGIIVCAGGGVRTLIDVISSPVIARSWTMVPGLLLTYGGLSF